MVTLVAARAPTRTVAIRWGLIALAGSLALLLVQELLYLSFTIDDAFISFRYARAFALGQGLVFNPGERVEGYTNLLWTILLAIPERLGADRFAFGELLAAKGLGVVLSLATVLLVWQAGRHYRVAGRPTGSMPAVLAPLALACCGAFAAWSMSGLETPLVTFLLVLAGYCLLRAEHAPWWGGVLALAALTRPEPVLYFGVVLLWRMGSRLRQRTLAGMRADVVAVALFAVPYGAYLLWRHAYYGYWLPNTYYAKLGEVTSHTAAALAGAWYVVAGVVALGLGGLCLIGALPLLSRRASPHYRLVLVLFMAQLAVATYEGGDCELGFRFIVPALPFLALLFQDGCSMLRTSQPKARPIRGLLIAVACVAPVFGALLAIDGGVPGVGRPLLSDSLVDPHYYAVAQWMRANVPSDDLVALGEAGIIPYYSKVRVLDMFGLMDTHLAHLPGSHFDKFDVGYVLGRRPQYILLAHAVRQSSGTLTSVHLYARDLWADPRFAQQYVLVRKFVDDPGAGTTFMLYERRANVDAAGHTSLGAGSV